MRIARVVLLFSFTQEGIHYPCALVRWSKVHGDSLDDNTGMWIVEPAYDGRDQPLQEVIHLECIVRSPSYSHSRSNIRSR